MHLSKTERKEVMSAYAYEDSTEINHYEVGPDTWIYLFGHDDKKIILIVTDYTGDYEFDVFPYLLKFESDRLGFVLQCEIPIEDSSSEKAWGTLLFEYTD